MATNSNNVTGWGYFASFMVVVIGIFQSIMGLTALLDSKFYVALQGKLLVFDFAQWGWIHLLGGILLIMAGTSLFNGRRWAQIGGVILVILSLIAQFAYLSVYPVWSVIIMVIDVLVIYALTVHGDELNLES